MSFTFQKTYRPSLRLLSVPAACLGIFAVQPATVQANALSPVEISEGTEGIDLTDPALLTTYESLIQSTDMEGVGTLTAKVSRGGRTTIRINSPTFRAYGRATIDESGEGNGTVRLGRSILVVNFQVSESGTSPGTYVLTGDVSNIGGGVVYTFEAIPHAYSSRDTPVETGDYTMGLLGATDPVGDVPIGDGAGTAKVSRGGRVRFSGYNADASRLRSNAYILEGGTVIFYSKIGNDGAAIGELTFQDIANMSDFDGSVDYTRDTTGRGAYPGAYSYTTNCVGNRYSQQIGIRNAMGLENTVNNAVLRMTGGPLDGLDFIGTVDFRGRITIPRTQTASISGRVNTRSGISTGNVNYRDPASGYIVRNRAKFIAAVLPKMDPPMTLGSYNTYTGAGSFEIAPNVDGDLPAITTISPRVQGVGELGGGYQVRVIASEPWRVVIPEEYESWVTVTPDSGVVDDVTGNANGVVNVLVARTISQQDREAYLRIAGQNHVVVQKGKSGSENIVAINPEEMTVGILGGNYFVSIDATSPNSIPDTGFFSPVDWVTVLPVTDPNTGILIGANITVAEPTGGITVGDPSAVLRSAEVLVGGVRHFVSQVFAIVPGEPDPEPVPASDQ